MIECFFNITCTIVINTVKYGFYVFDVDKIEIICTSGRRFFFLTLEYEEMSPQLENLDQFFFCFHLGYRDRMSVEFLSSGLLYLTIVIRNKKIVWKHRLNWLFFLCNLSSENSKNPVLASLHEI